MKKFILENAFLRIFPDSQIGVIICEGIDNSIKDENRYVAYLEEAQKAASTHIKEPVFTDNPVVSTWREAFRKFKTKKGARCSIEALLKRVSKGGTIGTINPLVDIYNGISMKYGVPVGGEDISSIRGNLCLTIAEGGEEFVTLGSDKSEPPYPGEVVYRDDAGAVCRCFNWRESVRTMLTEDTTDAFMCLEAVDFAGTEAMKKALEEMAQLIEKDLGGRCSARILDQSSPETVISEN